MLDLKYDEDSQAEVDMNIISTADGRFIEIQGTAERQPFSRQQMDQLLGLAEKGIKALVNCQLEALSLAARAR
jgi:ribonuclease PH